MENNDWKKAMDEKKLKEGVPVSATVDEKNIFMVRLEGRICACGNECTHYGAPLTDGVLCGHTIICPWHNAKFDVTDGTMTSPPALNNLPAYEVKVENGQVYVRPSGSPTIKMPSGKDDRTFLIIGAGASGNAAAETLRREGFCGRIVMITGEPNGPYDRTMLSKDYLSGEAPAKWLTLRREKFYNRLKIELLTNHPVKALDPKTRSVTFENSEQLKGDKLLLATGGIPRTLDISGADLPGCFLLRKLGDAEAIISACEQAEQVVILGAGFIGLEVASSMRHRNLEVHVVAPEQVPLASVFGKQVGRRIQRLHEDNKVHFHLGQMAKELKGEGKVREVVLSDGSLIRADIVIIGIGIRPAVDFLIGTGLVKNGAVPVNSQLQTEAEGIFASGDIAVVPDHFTGEPRRVEHWVEAERQGQHAAWSILGQSGPYAEVPFFWTRQFGNSLKYVGYAPKFDRVVFRGDVESGSFLAGYYVGGNLKAAAGLSMVREFIMLGEMLQKGGGITPEQFQDVGFDLAEVLT